MDAFSQLVSAGLAVQQDFASAPAVYCRPASEEGEQDQFLDIHVAWGSTEFEEFSERAMMLSSESRDALIRNHAALLEAFGEPEPGDVIVQYGISSEVMSNDSEPCWRYDGPGRHYLRIHTKVTGE